MVNPLTRIHLYGFFGFDHNPVAIKFVYIFSIIAGFVLLIACINFMNLATARSANRAREIGMRKVVGAYRKDLIFQFIGESLLLSLFAVVISVVFVLLLLTVFNTIAGKEIQLNALFNSQFILGILLITIITGLVFGSYPSLFLSGFKPVKVLKGNHAIGHSQLLRRIADELSYDKHHSKAERLYRVCRLYIANGIEEDAATLSFPSGPAIKNAYPDKVEKMCRFFNFQVPKMMFEYEGNDKKFYETRVFLADSTVLDMFDFEFIRGDKETALNRPFVMIITESIAKKYFGDEDPMGKTFVVEEQGRFEVSGVIKDLPKQTHLEFDFLGSMSSVRQIFGGRFPQTWIWNPCWTYVLLPENVSPGQLEELFPEFHKNHFFDFPDQDITLYLQKLTDIHLKSRLLYEIRQNSNMIYIYLLAGIAIFILIIASINFMNLATASSAGRAKEIGVKKVLGAVRTQLILQFLSESVFTTFLSLIVSVLLVLLLLTPFNNFTQKNFSPALFAEPGILAIMFCITLFIGILAGLYPAFFLSAFQPVKMLKGTLSSGSKGGTTRKVLIVIQFTISVILIIGTLVIFRQLKFMKKADLGFTKDKILALPCWNTQIIPQNEAFINELLQHPSITHACGIEDLVGVDHNTHQFF